MFKIVLSKEESFSLTPRGDECFQLRLRDDENFGLATGRNEECFRLILRNGGNFNLTADGLVQGVSTEGVACTLIFATAEARGFFFVDGIGTETLMELATTPTTGKLNVLGGGVAELELETSAGGISGKLYGTGSAGTELIAELHNNGSALTADQTVHRYDYLLATSSAATAMAIPSYVGDDIDKTINELGDITTSEFCRKEVVA